MTEISREDLLSAKEWIDFIDARQINHAWHVENSKTIRQVLEDRLNQVDIANNTMVDDYDELKRSCEIERVNKQKNQDWKAIAEEMANTVTNMRNFIKESADKKLQSEIFFTEKSNIGKTIWAIRDDRVAEVISVIKFEINEAISKYEQAIKGDER